MIQVYENHLVGDNNLSYLGLALGEDSIPFTMPHNALL